MTDLPTHNCLVLDLGLVKEWPHKPHDWWYTSYGGGHQMYAGFDPKINVADANLEKDLKRWHCPGKEKQ